MRGFRYILILLFILGYRGLSAQEFDLYDFRYYKRFDTVEELLAPDDKDSVPTPKFALNRQFTTNSLDHNFSMVRYARRGRQYYRREVTLNGVEIPFVGYSSIRALQIRSKRTIDETALTIDSLNESKTSTAFAFSSRNTPYSISLSTSQRLHKGWSLAANIEAKTGRDLHIEGLFGNSLEADIVASKLLNNKGLLSFAIFANPRMRSSRLASTAEAFRLIGNNLYNPAWGYRNGKICNSRIRRECAPTAFIGYNGDVGKHTRVELAASATSGIKKQSSLEWFDTQTPLPDNYRYMPSFFDDEDDIFIAVEDVWRNNDTRYTQIDFDRLISTNRLNGKQATYAISDRVARVINANFRGCLASSFSKFSILYGIEAKADNTRNYKQMRDLLEAEYTIDMDYFLLDDDTFGNSRQNNLNNPNRKVAEGDRYGYDYTMRQYTVCLFGTFKYSTQKLDVEISAKAGYSSISRRGFYRKELFANNSFGPSRNLAFSPYSMRIHASYQFADNHLIRGSIATKASPCEAENLFLQTQYNNRIVDNPEMVKEHSAEFQYMFQQQRFKLSTTLFFSMDCNDSYVRHLYDDLSGQYADVVTRDISRLRYGLELESELRFTEHFRAIAALSIGRYHYATNPLVSIYSDTSNILIADKVESHVKGLSLGNAPQIAASAGLSYYNKGWYANINVNYAGFRYIEPSLIMRTERILFMTTSPEQYNNLLEQERLPDAFTMDISLSKSLYLSRLSKRVYSTTAVPHFEDKYPRSRLVFRIGVRNLLGSSDIIYNAYESSRLQRYKLAGEYIYSRQASRYMYAYPRTFYASMTFAF